MAVKKPSPKKSTAKSALNKKKKPLAKVDTETLDKVTGGIDREAYSPVSWVVDRS